MTNNQSKGRLYLRSNNISHSTCVAVIQTSFGAIQHLNNHKQGIFPPRHQPLISQLPILSARGITSYDNVNASASANGTHYVFAGDFLLSILSTDNTTSSLSSVLQPIFNTLTSRYGDKLSIQLTNVTPYPTFYEWWYSTRDDTTAGIDEVIGSRLLSERALQKATTLEVAIRASYQSRVP